MWVGIAALLLAPLAAMRFSREVRWDAQDFAAAAILLTGTGAAIELAFRLFHRPLHRIAGIAAVVGAGALIWADAAVGVLS